MLSKKTISTSWCSDIVHQPVLSTCFIAKPALLKPLQGGSCLHASTLLNASNQQKVSVWGRKESQSSSAPTRKSSTLTKQKPALNKSKTLVPAKSKGKKPQQDDEEEDKEGWALFDASKYAYQWNVPWGLGTTTGGLALWFLSFVVVGVVAIPGLYRYAGLDITTLPMASKANFTLICQAVETVVGLSVIRLITYKKLEDQEDASDDPADALFNYSLQDPFKAPYGWGTWAIAGVVLSPVVVGLTATLVSVIGYDNSVGGKGTVDGVVGMINMDGGAYLSLLAVTGIMAPILEETVFRGFLLPSLTKTMPTWAAVLVSSAAFGAAHLSARDLPVLFALGCLLGTSYVRSRNLLTPIIIHGVWNSTVLTLLFAIAASGLDVEQVLKELR